MNTGSSSTTVEVLNSMERSSFSTNRQDVTADVVDTLYEDSRDDRIRIHGNVSNEQDDETLARPRDDKELISIFWADETARLNFKMFGDALSFDATYRTNEHTMVFVPFVAVDNHKKSVVVGVALINSETVPNYTWILKAFMKAHGQQPRFVITDQCAAMKQAIPIAFPNSKHRLCMWHITKKLSSKVTLCDLYQHYEHPIVVIHPILFR
ncbi:hypothetical protein L6452_38607 [Arctium lappa]|uniref:Uncharacterized protein n=1 Tax=Arctium lappa TaxID=4217 RepID=A0ACB8XR66_ARCLA|nr:hypothetical protein L6452_38607 [Arctium lappa]